MKTHLLNLLFLCSSLSFFGQQDTIYLNDKFEKTNVNEKAIYYKIIEKVSENRTIEKLFQNSGQLKFKTAFLSNRKGKNIRDGKHSVFYPNGRVRIAMDFIDGKKNGEFVSYWENGTLKRKDIYKKNTLVSGECWNFEGIKIDYYDFEEHAVFPGGKKELSKYIYDNIRIDSSKSNIRNRIVKVKFYINENGKVSKPEFIIRSHDIKTDVLIIQTILNMPKWKPALRDNTPIGVWKLLPITIKNR